MQSPISYLKKMMDLLCYHFIRDLVGGSNELLGYRNKAYSFLSLKNDVFVMVSIYS